MKSGESDDDVRSAASISPMDVSYTDPSIARTLWMSPIATIVTDAVDGTIFEVNDACCSLFECSREALLGKRTVELGIWADPADRARMVAEAEIGARSQHFEITIRTLNGGIRTVLTTIARFEMNNRPFLLGQMSDMTGRTQIEQRLRMLDRIARIGHETSSYRETLEQSLRAIHEMFPSVSVGYGTFENGLLRLEASCRPPGVPAIDGIVVDLGISPTYLRALMDGESLLVPDVREDDRFTELRESLLELGIYAVLDVPVRREEKTVGLLFLEASEPTVWTEHHLATLTQLASLLAVSLFRARAEEDLRRERGLIQTVMDYVPDFLYVKDVNSRFTRVNKAVSIFHGFDDPRELIGKSDLDLFPEELAQQFLADEQAVIASGHPDINRLEPQNAEQTIWSLTSTVPFRGSDGAVVGIVGTCRDVTEQHEMLAALRTSDSRQRALIEALPDMVLRIRRDGELLDVRANRQDDESGESELSIGANIAATMPVPAATEIMAGIRESLESGKVVAVEYDLDRPSSSRTFDMRIAPCGDDQVVAIARDVTERKMLEERLAHRATHDPLTGLPNRNLFTSRLNEALVHAHRDETLVAVLFIDLDRFKQINDTFGHAAGDRLLCTIADSLRRSVRSGDTIARIGGDEFAVLLDELPAGDEAAIIAARISDQIARPIRIGRISAHVNASIGIAVGRPDRDSAESLLDEADHAMYESKRALDRRDSKLIQIEARLGQVEPLPLAQQVEAAVGSRDARTSRR